MQVRVQKWGNSLALRLPRVVAREANIHEGSVLDLTEEGDVLVIRPLKKPEYRLADLLDGISDDNLHAEVATASRMGAEEW